MRKERRAQTTGWRATCECETGGTIPCIVLDPFFGAGTTGLVCEQEGRNWIGVELVPEYVKMARRRIKKARQRVGRDGPREPEGFLGPLPRIKGLSRS